MWRYLVILGVVSGVTATPAGAQPRGYVGGFGGAAATEVTSPVFGGNVGFDVGPHIQITGEFGRMNDVYPSFTRDDLRSAEQEAQDAGLLMNASYRMPVFYGVGGARVRALSGSRVQPFFSAEGGFARLTPKPSFVIEGMDLTSTVLQDPDMKSIFAHATRPMLVLGGGVTVAAAPHVSVDIGYRYSHIFIQDTQVQSPDSPHQHSGIVTHGLQFGVAYRF